MGAVDAYFDWGFHIWDYAAPLLIVTEAGGVAMDITGGKVDYLARRMLAASSKDLADQILQSVATVPMERDWGIIIVIFCLFMKYDWNF